MAIFEHTWEFSSCNNKPFNIAMPFFVINNNDREHYDIFDKRVDEKLHQQRTNISLAFFKENYSQLHKATDDWLVILDLELVQAKEKQENLERVKLACHLTFNRLNEIFDNRLATIKFMHYIICKYVYYINGTKNYTWHVKQDLDAYKWIIESIFTKEQQTITIEF